MKSFGLAGLQLHPKLTDVLFYTRLKSKPQVHTILTTQQFKTTTILQVLVYHQDSGKYRCEEARVTGHANSYIHLAEHSHLHRWTDGMGVRLQGRNSAEKGGKMGGK